MKVRHQVLTDKSGSSAASFAVQRCSGGTAFAFLALMAYSGRNQTPPLAVVLPPVLWVLFSPASTRGPRRPVRPRCRKRTLRDPCAATSSHMQAHTETGWRLPGGAHVGPPHRHV